MLIDHDVHVHTTLSACCHDPEATPANILARAHGTELRTIGFADHLWDAVCPGASAWYAPQHVEHVQRLRQQIRTNVNGVRTLFGCESEYCGDGKVGLSRGAAAAFDFVLLPMSHLHMKDFVVPADVTGTRGHG